MFCFPERIDSDSLCTRRFHKISNLFETTVIRALCTSEVYDIVHDKSSYHNNNDSPAGLSLCLIERLKL